MIVEDGTKVTGANSYITEADADVYMSTYHSDDGWGGTSTEKETLLILATRSMDMLYGKYYMSMKEEGATLLFPRYSFYDKDGTLITSSIPQSLKDAVCETALIKYNGGSIVPLPNTDADSSSSKIKIGPIEISSSGSRSNTDVETYVGFYEIEKILRPIIKLVNTVTTMVR